MKTALVLSAGGMFGAYQAGAWSALAGHFEPDLIVGASIGAVNGWAIAGGCSTGELIEKWLSLDCAGKYKLQRPRALHGGILDCRPLLDEIDQMYARFRPRIPYALVVTELGSLKPRIIPSDAVTPDALKATTAIFGLFEQVRMEGKLYTDGGTLAALPVWAAVELGAERVVAIDALVSLPGLIPKLFVRVVKTLSRFRPSTAGVDIVRIAPRMPLGSGRDMLYWSREKAERWIEQGRKDAVASLGAIAAGVRG